MAGVAAVGAIDAFPFSGSDANGLFALRGRRRIPPAPATAGRLPRRHPRILRGHGHLDSRGRRIAAGDVPGREIVVVVNEDFVRKTTSTRERPIGRRIPLPRDGSLDEPLMTIVGVVAVKHALPAGEG